MSVRRQIRETKTMWGKLTLLRKKVILSLRRGRDTMEMIRERLDLCQRAHQLPEARKVETTKLTAESIHC